MLDQRHMLIGCRMQNDMRRTGAQQAIHSAGITYRSEKWHDVHVDLRCLSQPPELSINLIKREFAMIAEHQRSEEHTSELQSLMRISYAVFCLKKNKHKA